MDPIVALLVAPWFVAVAASLPSLLACKVR